MTTETTRRVDLIRKISIDAVTNQEASEVLAFGTFAVLQKKERPGRNPRTGKDAKISARRVISFKASPVLKKPVANFST